MSDVPVERRHWSARDRHNNSALRCQERTGGNQQARWVVDVLQHLRADRVGCPALQLWWRFAVPEQVTPNKFRCRNLPPGDLQADVTDVEPTQLSARMGCVQPYHEIALAAADIDDTGRTVVEREK